MARESQVVLPAESNQALGLGKFAVEFMSDSPGVRAEPSPAVLERTGMFHTDAVICGVSAIALGTNAPTVLRGEALEYQCGPQMRLSVLGSGRHPALRGGAPLFGSAVDLAVEKAVVANVAAVREWDANGTNFGYSEKRPEHRAGEFGHNDFYSVPAAAAYMQGRDGEFALRGMVLVDEIRGRLAEVFSLKTYKIDHVVHGAVASAATFGAMMGATAEEIESAIGMVVAHFIPWRAIRHGHQLSDSKGASAALSTEAAVLSVKRSMAGFVGPRDIFRNPEAVFNFFAARLGKGVDPRLAEKMRAAERSPFDLVLSRAGDDFTVMGMHFKLGLYEHQSAGALQGLIDVLRKNPGLLDEPEGERIRTIVIRAYEPAFGIIGDPAKRDPRTRQSADHSMLYLVCTVLRKALELRAAGESFLDSNEAAWKRLMLGPRDFDRSAITHPLTRKLMAKTQFEHGGAEYDAKYPDGIPTSVVIVDQEGRAYDSGLVMYPAGHARNRTANLGEILYHKWRMLASLAVSEPETLIQNLAALPHKRPQEVAEMYHFEILKRGRFE